jgi:ATP-dependent RNA helicase DeaD
MICRRGGIERQDIGAIRIYGAHTEFEISAQAAEQFSANMKRPDKEAAIRIEALPEGPQGELSSEQRLDEGGGRQNDKPSRERRSNHHGGAAVEAPATSDKPPRLDKKQRHEHRPHRAGQAPREHATPFAKPAFRKKQKKSKHRH